MSTASCKSITPNTTPTASSSLKGIFDDKALLRLAKVSSDETSTTYRFETCHPSGILCTGAFKNSQGTDVLISFKQLDDLPLSRAEHNAIEKAIARQSQLREIDYLSARQTSKTAFGAGVISTATGAILVGLSMAFNKTKGIGITLVSLGTGLTMISTGAGVMHLGLEDSDQANNKLNRERSEREDIMRSFNDLPKYLKVKHGLKSTDPNKHVRVSSSSSVYHITMALAQELNNTLHQQQNHTNLNVVESVCFMKSKGQEECRKPYSL